MKIFKNNLTKNCLILAISMLLSAFTVSVASAQCKKGNCTNGTGTFHYENETIYEGEWKNNERHGKGVCTWKDGTQYDGKWENDKENGQGKCTWSNGDRYEGTWINGLRTGFGEYFYSNGDIYKGDWQDGMKQGQGTMSYVSGEQKTAQWAYDAVVEAPRVPITYTYIHEGKKLAEKIYYTDNVFMYETPKFSKKEMVVDSEKYDNGGDYGVEASGKPKLKENARSIYFKFEKAKGIFKFWIGTSEEENGNYRPYQMTRLNPDGTKSVFKLQK